MATKRVGQKQSLSRPFARKYASVLAAIEAAERARQKLSTEWESNAPWITPALVRAARGLLGWSPQQLARQSGVAKSIIDKFESGTHDPAPPIRMQLVFAFSRNRVRFCRGDINGGHAKRCMVGVQLLGRPEKATVPRVKR